MSNRVMGYIPALNSLVLPIHKMGVSDAFILSHCSDGVIIADYLLFFYLIGSMNQNYSAVTLSSKDFTLFSLCCQHFLGPLDVADELYWIVGDYF